MPDCPSVVCFDFDLSSAFDPVERPTNDVPGVVDIASSVESKNGDGAGFRAAGRDTKSWFVDVSESPDCSGVADIACSVESKNGGGAGSRASGRDTRGCWFVDVSESPDCSGVADIACSVESKNGGGAGSRASGRDTRGCWFVDVSESPDCSGIFDVFLVSNSPDISDDIIVVEVPEFPSDFPGFSFVFGVFEVFKDLDVLGVSDISGGKVVWCGNKDELSACANK